MLRKTLFLAVAAVLAALATSAEAQAWGAYHVGYTHYGPSGVEHYGRTAAVGPYGAYSGGRAYGSSASGGASRYGYHYGTSSSAYRYGGYHYGSSYRGVSAGYYRRR